jgi:hypothetical protein
MDWQNLVYALTQVAHNFVAVAVLGGALLARWPVRHAAPELRRFGWLVLAGWVVQGGSGLSFGAISYAYYGQFPDIHGIAIAALTIKVLCAALGFLLAAAYLRYGGSWPKERVSAAWRGLIVLAAAALTAAAFLRWFS